MTKAAIVKKIIGEPLKKEGFLYAGYGRHRDKAWHFKRELEGLTQWIFIVMHRYGGELWIEIGVTRAGKDRIERYYDIKNFCKDMPKFMYTAGYSDDASFEKALYRILPLIYDYFLPGLEEISKEKYMDKWELTPEVYARFQDEKNQWLEVLSKHYETANMTEDKLLTLMIKAVKDCKEKKPEEVEDILMGLAAFFGDYIVENLEECWWEDSRYVCHRERYDHPCKQKYGTEYRDMQPLQIVKEVWREQNMNTICSWYNGLFVERRKRRKALSLWDREKEDKIAGTDRLVDWAETGEILMPFIEQYGFRYNGYNGKKYGYLCYREGEEGRQEILMVRKRDTYEMWVKVVTKSGRELEIQDIREGLSPYDRAEYCLGEIISEGGQYIQTVNQLKEQIADIWIPVLDNEEAYFLQWELTPEMVRREFFDKEELLRGLDEAYGITYRTKEELPGFIKRILKENEDRSLEEFEDTLLGLSVLLGEMAIKEIEGSHWMWDKVRSACLVTYRNEVTGVDPAFALNYAWQRKKPENVDRLCQDLFEGNYIEDRGRGGYDIRKA